MYQWYYYCFPTGLFLLINLFSYYIYKLKHPDNSNWIRIAVLIVGFGVLLASLWIGKNMVSWTKNKKYYDDDSGQRNIVYSTGSLNFVSKIESIKELNIEISRDIKNTKNTCFFRALAKEYFGDQEKWKEVYELIFGYIRDDENKEKLEEIFGDGIKDYEKFVEKYSSGEIPEIELARIFAAVSHKTVIIIGPWYLDPTWFEPVKREGFHIFSYDKDPGVKESHMIVSSLEEEIAEKLIDEQKNCDDLQSDKSPCENRYIKLVLRKDHFQTFKIIVPKEEDSKYLSDIIEIGEKIEKEFDGSTLGGSAVASSKGAGKPPPPDYSIRKYKIPEEFRKQMESRRLTGFDPRKITANKELIENYEKYSQIVSERLYQEKIEERLEIAKRNQDIYEKKGQFNLLILWESEGLDFIINLISIGKRIEEYINLMKENRSVKEFEVISTPNIREKIQKSNTINPRLLQGTGITLNEYLKYHDIVMKAAKRGRERTIKAYEKVKTAENEAEEKAEEEVKTTEEALRNARNEKESALENLEDAGKEYRKALEELYMKRIPPKTESERIFQPSGKNIAEIGLKDVERKYSSANEAYDRAKNKVRDLEYQLRVALENLSRSN